ncbi:endo alpha-1,4 polygalactosaminidase [Nonomuraea sp. LPB2021202275-12-8]|uniref:endo alpha-1,4 polygalactosaminidase n=1 Tax=Nonomuraea sp. LPB2021202275-12-8 TaxID=3120159 RepID=UPI00300C1CA1
MKGCSFPPVGAALAVLTALAGCVTGAEGRSAPALREVTSFTYVLQRYPEGRLDAVARAPHQLAIVDLSRDGTAEGAFTAEEVARVRGSGKLVLAYFEIGSIEEFRTEFEPLRDRHADLMLNIWADWPDEHFVKYWEPGWWSQVIRPKVDQALRAGFDGVYLDTPLAYEEIDLARVPGETRATLGRKMVDLIIKISAYAKKIRPGFSVVPQNSPELRHFSGYVGAIDGIGMEELFFRATDRPCRESWCQENLADALALRKQGKAVLATDYARSPENIKTACAHYRRSGIAGNVTMVDLDRISPPCQ